MAVRNLSRVFLFLSICSLLSCYLYLFQRHPLKTTHSPPSHFNLSSPPSLLPRRHGADAQQRRLSHPVPPRQHRQQHRPPSTFHLDPAQELAAVSAFLASVPQNALPPTVDPSRTIDPELVLDFDVSAPSAVDEVRVLVDEFWARNPVVLFSKVHSAASREIKAILDVMQLHPPPTIFDVDQRSDADTLIPLLARLTDTPSLPVLFVGGTLTATATTDMRALHEGGELSKRVRSAGATIRSRDDGKGAIARRRRGRR